MKTKNQFFSHILKSVTLIAAILFINTAFAGTRQVVRTHDQNQTTEISKVQIENDEVAVPSSPVFEDAKYWVNYLNSTVNVNDDTIQITNSLMDDMQNNPVFWIDYLKQNIAEV